MKQVHRRFIAGAKCPQCGLLDKLYIDEEARQVVCTRCDYRYDEETPEPPKAVDAAQPVVWVTPPKKD